MAERLALDALQLGVYQRLTDGTDGIGAQWTDNVARVYDELPSSIEYPFVEIGSYTGERVEGAARTVKTHNVGIHFYSKGSGYRELKDLMNAAQESVTKSTMALGDNFQLIDAIIESFDAFKEFDDETEEILRHGVLRIQCLVQDVS